MSQLTVQAISWINSNSTLRNSSSTLHILYSICHNIVLHPSELKFRTIRLDNPKLKSTIVDVEGAIDLLYLCGFEMDSVNHCLTLSVVDQQIVKELNDLGNLFESYCSEEHLSPRHLENVVNTPKVRHHDLFHEVVTTPHAS